MNVQDLIIKKRNGGEHSAAEIDFLVQGMGDMSIPDYQLAAWAMAVYFQGMSPAETHRLTMAMAASGDTVDLSAVAGLKADKHSTGGVGDKTTPIVLALCAAAGLVVAKMSGRGLGHTGGTIDKFESIPGFRSTLNPQEFVSQLQRVGAAVVGQSGNMVPADKRLYALRDVTGTVDSIPLIASSVMSKKIAAGSDIIVLDVKCGSGAFMAEFDDARTLAITMVDIGKKLGRRVAAVISNMDQPLGRAIGNSLEIIEALEVLKGAGPEDLKEISLVLATQMLVQAGREPLSIRSELEEYLENGIALTKFLEFVVAQGGNVEINVEEYNLAVASEQIEVVALESGWVKAIQAKDLGQLCMHLGAGREKLGDSIDHTVGVVLNKKIGDYIEKNEKIAMIYARHDVDREYLTAKLRALFQLVDYKVEPGSLVLDIIS